MPQKYDATSDRSISLIQLSIVTGPLPDPSSVLLDHIKQNGNTFHHFWQYAVL